MAQRTLPAALALLKKLQTAIRRYERANVVDLLRQLIERRAPLGGQWARLSQIAASSGEIGLARAAIDLFVESSPGDPAAGFRKAELLAHIGAWSDALELLRDLPGDGPVAVDYAYLRGMAAMYCGAGGEARDWLLEAVRLRPQASGPWLSLAMLVDLAADVEVAEMIFANQRAMQTATPSDFGNYCYALGKAHADRGEHPAAFAAISHGAALIKPQIPYDRRADRLTAIDAIGGYDSAGMAALAARQSEPTGRGIIVTGLPRSGTTLVEQILTSHSQVSDGGEIYRLGLLAGDIRGRSCPALTRYVDRGHAPEAARLWRHWLDERFPEPGRVVDKTPDASRLLGIAAALLPEAPLVWLVRDPLDCAWSCFRTRFSGEAAWSHDLEDIAFHFRLERELLAVWSDLLGDRLLVVPYEKLAGTPERWIPRILAHCGLDPEPGVFAPHENPRAVTTSSAMQVRRPIDRSGIGSAEPYRAFLAPFVDAWEG
jgi:tetratricopeptide (TPR) repeat protein